MNKYTQIFEDHKLPAMAGKVIDMRHQVGSGDWWAKTKKGWFYCRAQDVDPERRQWQHAPYGP